MCFSGSCQSTATSFCTPTVACGTVIFVNATLVTFLQSPERSGPNKYRHAWFCFFFFFFPLLYFQHMLAKPPDPKAVFIHYKIRNEIYLESGGMPSMNCARMQTHSGGKQNKNKPAWKNLLLHLWNPLNIISRMFFISLEISTRDLLLFGSGGNHCEPFISLLTLCTTTSWQALHWINHGYWLGRHANACTRTFWGLFLDCQAHFNKDSFMWVIVHASSHLHPPTPPTLRK